MSTKPARLHCLTTRALTILFWLLAALTMVVGIWLFFIGLIANIWVGVLIILPALVGSVAVGLTAAGLPTAAPAIRKRIFLGAAAFACLRLAENVMGAQYWGYWGVFILGYGLLIVTGVMAAGATWLLHSLERRRALAAGVVGVLVPLALWNTTGVGAGLRQTFDEVQFREAHSRCLLQTTAEALAWEHAQDGHYPERLFMLDYYLHTRYLTHVEPLCGLTDSADWFKDSEHSGGSITPAGRATSSATGRT